MADSSTLTPPEAEKQALPSVDDLVSQFNAPSYAGADAGDNMSTEAKLNQAKNRDRIQKSNQSPGLNLSNTTNQKQEGGQGAGIGIPNSQSFGQSRPQTSGAKDSNNSKEATSNGGRGDKGKGGEGGGGGDSEDKSFSSVINKARNARRDQEEKKSEEDPDYPYPISNRRYAAWSAIALAQDLFPLLFDAVGIGWIIGYMMLPFTWAMYIYLIIRFVPKPLFWKFIFRSALTSALGIIPGLGELLPEWAGVAVGGYIMIKEYELGLGGADSKGEKSDSDSKDKKKGGGNEGSAQKDSKK